jgi:hypothetical protein
MMKQKGDYRPGSALAFCVELRQAKRELKQAYVVIDAINTLTTRDRSTVLLGFHGGLAFVSLSEAGWGIMTEADTLREALESCVAARNQHDKEAK